MGRTTWRWHEPCRTQQFALLFAERMLRNLGASVHCFGQLMRAIFLRSSLITRRRALRTLHHRDSINDAAQVDMGSSRSGGHIVRHVTCHRACALAQISKLDSKKKTKRSREKSRWL